MSETVVKVEGLSKKFCTSLKRSMIYGTYDAIRDMVGISYDTTQLRKKEFWALQDLNFELKQGETLGLIGQNGCGKTTLLRLINGIFPPDKGKITIKGRIGALIAIGAGFHPHMTGKENIFLNGTILGMTKQEIKSKLDDIIDFAEIGEFLDAPVATYSSGMTVRLGFAIAIHCEPEILLVDEILAVGDVSFRMKCYQRIIEMKEKGTAIILVTHSMLDIGRVCDKVIILKNGRYVKETNVADGISLYERLNIENLRSDKITKSKQIEIISVETFDKHGNKQQFFKSFDDIYVEVKIHNKGNLEKNCRLIIHIETPSYGVLGSFSSPFQNKYFDLDEGIKTIKFQIHDAPLLQGIYYINVAVNGKELTKHFDWYKYIHFVTITEPKTDSFGYGLHHLIYFKHTWKG
jgi:lipopolysaccharide transport system ATP-binding protein